MKSSVLFKSYFIFLALFSVLQASEPFSEEKTPLKRTWSNRTVEWEDDETESFDVDDLEQPKKIAGEDFVYRVASPESILVGINPKFITKIDCRGVQLVEFPMAILDAIYLLELNLAETGLKKLPIAIQRLPIRTLDLSINGMKDLPQVVCDMMTLRILILDQNEIQMLPSDLGKLRLVEFHCGDNQLKKFPLEILKMSSLQVLDLSENKIPNIIYNLCDLKSMNIFHIGTPSNKLLINNKVYKENASGNNNFSFMGEQEIMQLYQDVIRYSKSN